MNLIGLKKYLGSTYPVLPIERLVSHRRRQQIRKLIGWGIVAVVILILVSFFRSDLNWLVWYWVGGGMILVALWLKIFLLESFFFAAYFNDEPTLADFETALLIHSLSTTDVTGSFLNTALGREIVRRAGVSDSAVHEFLTTRISRLALAQCVVTPMVAGEAITLADLARAIYQTDREFGQFLFKEGVQVADLVATATWIVRTAAKRKSTERWWSREVLGRIPGIAKDWSYGRAYTLGRYIQPLPPARESNQEYNYNRGEVEKVEAVLARGREDNVMLVGDDNERKLEIIALLAKLITEDKVLAPLAHKEIILLDAAAFSATNDDKGAFERGFIKAMNDAVHAGNLIVVFPEFTALAHSAQTLGSDLAGLIEPYLVSPDLQIVALCTTDEFHRVWEGRMAVMERFDKIILTEVSGAATLRVLEDEVLLIERVQGVFFTRPALQAIVESAERYFPGGILPDAAIDLAFDLASQKRDRHIPITKGEVETLIKTKTGIPIGVISADERIKLVNLEQILHQRIIGQAEAVTGVANALRRARTGISNPNRPLGTFLFLGPTGVGKTETTKALAQAYFSDDKKIHRLDMSEYSSTDALDKLMGILADKIREQPYGILLLDEFEKAASKVHNLFLQILDEGFFSDSAGKRVNVRNHLIIATSNAGSDLIWETMKAGKDLLAEKNNIVDELIKRDIFKPELLNRFDGVILFHPLRSEDLKQIAKLMLDKLAERLRARGTILEVNNDLVNYLIERGMDPKFGARAMNRAIQDTVEQIVANKIMLENIKPGQTIVLTKADLMI
jgi:ATP-dependent Clp protease ATP-binding subunit ClpC